jgi:hypothetical protein
MANTDVQITEADLSEVLRIKVNEVTNAQVQLAALTRAVTERNAKIAELEAKLVSPNGMEAVNAKSGKEEVRVH